MSEKSIGERLKEAGYRHRRDARSLVDGRHSLFSDAGFIGRFDASEAVELLEGKRAPLRGRELYEADCIASPTYNGGVKRSPWEKLGLVEQESWSR